MRTSAPTITSTSPRTPWRSRKGVYRCPNVKLEGYNVFTNKPEGGQMRCVGHPAGMFPQEVHMDRLAEKLGMDPLAFRLKNYARKEDGDQDRKIPFASCRPGRVRQAGCGADRLGEQLEESRDESGSRQEGAGCGLSVLPARGDLRRPCPRSSSSIPDGTVELLSGLNDSGGWQKTTMAMIAAEELGIPYEAVEVTTGDTDATTDTGGPGGKPRHAQYRPCRDRRCQGCEKPAARCGGRNPEEEEGRSGDQGRTDLDQGREPAPFPTGRSSPGRPARS